MLQSETTPLGKRSCQVSASSTSRNFTGSDFAASVAVTDTGSSPLIIRVAWSA